MESESLIVWIIVFATLGGVLGVLAAGTFLLLPERVRARILPAAVSFAIGALLGAALLALLPEALEAAGEDGARQVMPAVLLGLLGFFVLEKMVIWRHCHVDECEVHGSHASEVHHFSAELVERAHERAAGTLILIGDGVHNFVDGVLIAAAFLTSIELGVVTSIAVIAHEVPQEIGDFAILLNSGFSRAKALMYNVLSSLTTVIGGVVAYFSLAAAQQALPYVLSVAAASFLYVAVADLIPGLHKRPEFRATVQQVVLIAIGVAVIFLVNTSLRHH